MSKYLEAPGNLKALNGVRIHCISEVVQTILKLHALQSIIDIISPLYFN